MNTVVPRRFLPDLPLEIPRHWLPGDPVVSSILNTYTVLVPANEAFYIRTLKACLPRLPAPLREQAVAFIHQEAQHGRRTSATGAISTPRAAVTAASSGRSTGWCSA